MTCSEFQQRLDAFLDNETDLSVAQEMQRHVEECADCEALFSARLAVRESLQSPELRFAPAADLRDQIRLQLSKQIRVRPDRPSWLSRFHFPDWLLPGLAGAAAVLVFWLGSAAVLSHVGSPVATGRTLAEQLVSNHLRSLVATHLIDVASSDQHTVKPWFAGKISFSPPVFDFSDQGFKLIGGRLDYLGNNEVAAIVFQHKQHYINLFVGPANQTNEPADVALQKEGFNLYGWTSNGLTFWAVTDAAPETLEAFADLEKKAAGTQ